jgi:hypothetical protein
MDEPIWKSEVTADMVGDLTEKEIGMLVEALDDAVAEICQEFDVG